jgi:hypothetical protein
MKTKKYITHNFMGEPKTTLIHLINYGDVVDGDKVKFITTNGEVIKPINEIKSDSGLNVIGFDEIDFVDSLWKWKKNNDTNGKTYRMDETITSGEIVKDNFWRCFDIMVTTTDTEILYKPILLP